MNLEQVLAQIQDLPSTYLREGSTFSQWMNSLAKGLADFTNGSDGVVAQLTFSQATGNWLNVWGLLFGVPRNPNESDPAYLTRISATVQAPHGTPVAMVQFLLLSLAVSATVTENLPSVGYTVTLGAGSSAANYTQVAAALDIVRPAGVPYTFQVPSGGLYLSTINYFGRGRSTGAYLTEATTALQPPIGASTNNTAALLPTTYLTDPVINPSLA